MQGVPVCLSLLLLLLTSSAGAGEMPPPAYSAQPIQGRVVDASTGQPLEGVIIVAQWVLYWTSVGGQNPHKRLQVLETVTASDGSYAFPGWGPKPNPLTIDPAKLYFCCFLTDRDPKLSYFKAGYRPLTLLNTKPIDIKPSVRTSDWDGKTIELEPFRGSPNEWATELHFLQGALGWSDMDWRTCPRIVLAIENERLRLPYRTEWSVSDLESLGTSRDEVLRALRRQP